MNPIETNKDFIRGYLQALSGQPKPLSLITRFVSHPGLIEHIEEIERAFPSYHLTAQQMIAEGDWVSVRGLFRGVHQGEFAGIAPTGRQVEAGLIILYRIEQERIVEYHLQFDLAGLLGQLNAAARATVLA